MGMDGEPMGALVTSQKSATPSAPATQTPTGPKVQTDGASSDGTRNAALALGLLGVGGAAVGAKGLRRR